jgi:hypothetical protein
VKEAFEKASFRRSGFFCGGFLFSQGNIPGNVFFCRLFQLKILAIFLPVIFKPGFKVPLFCGPDIGPDIGPVNPAIGL